MYVNGWAAHNVDNFSFSVFLPQCLPVGAKCEFCIRYVCEGKEYWDNNRGANYLVECRLLSSEKSESDEVFTAKKWL
ncbi:hypothetical protein AB6A40_011195 [Gnathostoma spinigerum]|uniref:CBM21 domain-containing protein n=1 Tax=Gnathostoma spinigerum TaxID=75299 RepID=A0ABD6EX52_9BILA